MIPQFTVVFMRTQIPQVMRIVLYIAIATLFTVGQRSSSLHYAACFGRPAIAKVLLRHGANPDLRDEDGKTPLDKARERIDEGHREVAAILQSPGTLSTSHLSLVCWKPHRIDSLSTSHLSLVCCKPHRIDSLSTLLNMETERISLVTCMLHTSQDRFPLQGEDLNRGSPSL
jgi:ankyrin repeat protein